MDGWVVVVLIVGVVALIAVALAFGREDRPSRTRGGAGSSGVGIYAAGDATHDRHDRGHGDGDGGSGWGGHDGGGSSSGGDGGGSSSGGGSSG